MGVIPPSPSSSPPKRGERKYIMEKNVNILLSPCKIKHSQATNRFVSQPMESNDADTGGKASDQTVARYEQLAQGQWGIIIVEAISISRTSMGRKNGLIINEDNLNSFKRLVGEVKETNPDPLILFQITHSGSNSGNFSEKVGVCPEAGSKIRRLKTAEIEEIKNAFVKGALLAEEAGADGVDFKMCHGYFGSEILRPSNVRKDKWGGSFENRTRFMRESIHEIKSQVQTEGFLIGARISMYEAIKGGCGTGGPEETGEKLSEMKKLVKFMHELEMDYVNVSAGIPGVTSEVTRPVKKIEEFCNNHFRYTKTAKDVLNNLNSKMKVIGSAYSVLKEKSFSHAEENIQKGYADFVGFGRQSFADPLFPKKFMDDEEINYCAACSACSELLVNQLHAGCAVHNNYYKKLFQELRQNK